MRTFRSCTMVAALLAAGCASGGHHSDGPAGIPYVCADGKPARVVHQGGGHLLRATARLLYDGRTIEMRSAPGIGGLRYVSEPAEGDSAVLVWSETGEEARLSEVPAAEAEYGEGRELVRCTRLRDSGHAPETHGVDEH